MIRWVYFKSVKPLYTIRDAEFFLYLIIFILAYLLAREIPYFTTGFYCIVFPANLMLVVATLFLGTFFGGLCAFFAPLCYYAIFANGVGYLGSEIFVGVVLVLLLSICINTKSGLCIKTLLIILIAVHLVVFFLKIFQYVYFRYTWILLAEFVVDLTVPIYLANRLYQYEVD